MKTHRICIRCKHPVRKETHIKEYPFYCPHCDENMYRFETINVRQYIKSKGQGADK